MTIDPTQVGAVAFGVAFLAGLLSFASPCVLPLVPVYIAYISGVTMAGEAPTGDSEGGRRGLSSPTFMHALAFVAGFSVLFVFIGGWLGLAGFILKALSGSESTASIGGLDFVVKDLLIRVGVVMLAVMAVRVADAPMSGDWRLRVGRFVLLWPGRVAGVQQKYVRWAIVGLLVALMFAWLSLRPREVTPVDAVLLAILPLAGVGLSLAGAVVLGMAAAIANSLSWIVNPVSAVFGPLEWVGVALQAVLIVVVVAYFSRTLLFYQEKRLEVSGRFRNKGYLSSGLMGAVFGAGWTPCTGPALVAILGLAGAAGTAGIGALLLAAYALGLGLPFLLVGLFFGLATGALRRVMPYMGAIKAVNTALLLFTAALLWSDRLSTLSQLGNWLELPG